MNKPLILGVPYILQSPIGGTDVLRLTSQTNSVLGSDVEFNALFTVNGVSNPATDAYIAVESHNRKRRLKVFMPDELDIVYDPKNGPISVEDLLDDYSAKGDYLGFRSDLADAPHFFMDIVPRFAPERLRSSGSALLGFTNVMAYYVRQLEDSEPIAFTVHPNVETDFGNL